MTAPIIIVTGANRGIGLALCNKILADPTLTPLRLLATTRKGDDLGLKPQNQDVNVQYPALDIADSGSIRAFADHVRKQGGEGSVRALINNAGVNLDDRYGLENARTTLDVNYRGTLEMCQHFLPLISQNGRIVNLSSIASKLGPYSDTIQSRFRDPKLSLADVDKLAEEFLSSVKSSTEQSAGFVGPGRSYSVSKTCINAFTAILARENPGLRINACCPGWVATDMGAQIGRPPKKPEEGARVPFNVAFGDIGGVTGKYWANDSVRSREEGKVQDF